MLSKTRPRPSMLIRTPAVSNRVVKAVLIELTALIAIEDLGAPMVERLLQGLKTEGRVLRV